MMKLARRKGADSASVNSGNAIATYNEWGVSVRAIITSVVFHRRLLIAWVTVVTTVLLLGIFRVSTGAEYALSSAVIIPVVLVAWAGGFRHGTVASVLAAFMWIVSDLLTQQEIGVNWIAILNGVTRLSTYFLWRICLRACSHRYGAGQCWRGGVV